MKDKRPDIPDKYLLFLGLAVFENLDAVQEQYYSAKAEVDPESGRTVTDVDSARMMTWLAKEDYLQTVVKGTYKLTDKGTVVGLEWVARCRWCNELYIIKKRRIQKTCGADACRKKQSLKKQSLKGK